MSIILVADKNGNPIGGIKSSPSGIQTNARSILRDRLALGTQGTSHQGSRDYYEILGYQREPSTEDFRGRFERDPMAGRVVEFPPEETWRDTPTIKDGADKEAKEDTPFCTAWATLAKRMRIYHYCQRVDILAGVGRFGLLHIGVAGGGDLTTEVKQLSSLKSVIYIKPYSEENVEVYEWETNPANPRFGLPHMYRLTITDMAGIVAGSAGVTTKQIVVHWSRCIHVAEGLLENEVYGRPRLQRVINLLDDILKVVGGSAEATWKLMRKGFVLNIDPEATMKPEEEEALEEQFDEYDHGLRRYLQTKGMTVSDLGSETVDPSGLFDVIVTLVSVATRIPKRILLGSERGELASSQDASNWAGAIASRQLNFAEPVILRPVIDRLISWGALPEPTTGEYTVGWDPLFEKSETEVAAIAKTWAEALEKAAIALGGPVMTVEEYRGEFTPFAAKMKRAKGATTNPEAIPMGDGSEVAPDNIESTQGLNGIQIRAAVELLHEVTAGTIAASIALELLISLGIDRERAQAMVTEAENFETKEPEGGKDVLDQVGELVGNHGYNGAQGRALIMAAARIVSRQGA